MIKYYLDTPEIVSKIDGNFEGLKRGSIFKLTNGQVWKQVSFEKFKCTIHSPDVAIFPALGVWKKMRVRGVNMEVTVQKVR